jgi:hypothetical protein
LPRLAASPILLVLDNGTVSRLADRSTRALALIHSLRTAELWPPIVPTTVIVESLHRRPGRDANITSSSRPASSRSLCHNDSPAAPPSFGAWPAVGRLSMPSSWLSQSHAAQS